MTSEPSPFWDRVVDMEALMYAKARLFTLAYETGECFCDEMADLIETTDRLNEAVSDALVAQEAEAA